MGLHTWRLIADGKDFEAAEILSRIVEETETEPIDHWFDHAFDSDNTETVTSVFAGRGDIPRHPFIIQTPCPRCRYHTKHVGSPVCTWCYGNGFVLNWEAPAGYQIEEAIQGLREIIRELEDPHYVERRAA